jgi:uncharacterized membrane protein
VSDAAARRGLLLVTLCYCTFMLSDGALRMLVLLHLHANGQTPLALALLLLPYEAAGVITNLLGGWLGSRHGQRVVLLAGLLLQIVACALLCADEAWLSVPYLAVTQLLSGIAKDLAKTASKSYVRVMVPEASAGALFGIVSWMTGSKNTMKGLGFFLGGAVLAQLGFRATNVALLVLLLSMLLAALCWLPRTARTVIRSFTALFAQQASVQWLAVARLFLFASRDAWFAVALPLYLVEAWGWSTTSVGALLACWVIGYGLVQAAAPRILRTRTLLSGASLTILFTMSLAVPLAITWWALQAPPSLPWVLCGLFGYGVLFALTSSLHSWLVVAVAGVAGTAERIGFYYAANALGRLTGLLASGWLFGHLGGGAAGIAATLLLSIALVGCAALTTVPARARQP